MRSALFAAYVALLPFRPKRRDLKIALTMAKILDIAKVANSKLKIYSCITQAPTLPSQAPRIQAAKNLLNSLNMPPLRYVTRYLNGWDDADKNGLSALEWSHDSKAGEDARAVFDELMETDYMGKLFGDLTEKHKRAHEEKFITGSKVDGSKPTDRKERRGGSYNYQKTGGRITLSVKRIQVPVNGHELKIINGLAKDSGLPIGILLRKLAMDLAKRENRS